MYVNRGSDHVSNNFKEDLTHSNASMAWSCEQWVYCGLLAKKIKYDSLTPFNMKWDFNASYQRTLTLRYIQECSLH